MANAPEVDSLLSLAINLEMQLGFANSEIGYDEQGDGGRWKTRTEVVKRWGELTAAVEAAKPYCPTEAIALRTALANALHYRTQAEIKPARDALEAAACDGRPAGDEFIGPHSPAEFRKRFRMSETTFRRERKNMRVDVINTKLIRIHRDDVARYENK